MSLIDATPRISIIIPVFNDLKSLKKVIQAVIAQDYPKDKVEVIVVDNGSTEKIKDYLSEINDNNILFIEELNYKGSPYSCRNRGIEKSTGEVIVLLDATCIPGQGWLYSGIQELIQSSADFVGGDVQFDVSETPSIAEIYDATMNVRMDLAIRQRNCAFTANLFIKKKLFDRIGMFPEGIRSGGDVRWTKKATKNGAVLTYSKSAVVLKKTRNKKQIFAKKRRTSEFQTIKWVDIGAKYLFLRHLKAFLKLVLLPPSLNRIDYKNRLTPTQYQNIPWLKFRIWFLDYRLRIVEGFGIIRGAIKYLISKI